MKKVLTFLCLIFALGCGEDTNDSNGNDSNALEDVLEVNDSEYLCIDTMQEYDPMISVYEAATLCGDAEAYVSELMSFIDLQGFDYYRETDEEDDISDEYIREVVRSSNQAYKRLLPNHFTPREDKYVIFIPEDRWDETILYLYEVSAVTEIDPNSRGFYLSIESSFSDSNEGITFIQRQEELKESIEILNHERGHSFYESRNEILSTFLGDILTLDYILSQGEYTAQNFALCFGCLSGEYLVSGIYLIREIFEAYTADSDFVFHLEEFTEELATVTIEESLTSVNPFDLIDNERYLSYLRNYKLYVSEIFRQTMLEYYECGEYCPIGADYVDADFDGYSIMAGDCNDFDSDMYPYADEIPDFKDTDCNGEVDDFGSEVSFDYYTDHYPENITPPTLSCKELGSVWHSSRFEVVESGHFHTTLYLDLSVEYYCYASYIFLEEGYWGPAVYAEGAELWASMLSPYGNERSVRFPEDICSLPGTRNTLSPFFVYDGTYLVMGEGCF